MPETYLMIHPVKGQVFAFSGRGFTYIQGRAPKVMRRVAGALFLDRTGRVKSVADITPERDGALAGLGRLLGLGGAAAFRFDLVDLPVDSFRQLLLVSLEQARRSFDLGGETWWPMVAPMDEVYAELGQAGSLAELHAMMRFPPDEDCLDLL